MLALHGVSCLPESAKCFHNGVPLHEQMPASTIHTGDTVFFVVSPEALITKPTGPARCTVPSKIDFTVLSRLWEPKVLAATTLTLDVPYAVPFPWLLIVGHKFYPFVTTVTFNCDDRRAG